MKIHSIIYNWLFIPAAKAAASIFRLFIPKIKEREDNALKIFKSLPDFKSQNVIWFHASSMGEFEQAKPIIENIKKMSSDIKIVCSFFSPSGYINQKNYEYADATCYMLLDTKSNAEEFILKINPRIAIFIRYDIWRNHLKVLKNNNIPAFLINATYPNSKALTSTFLLKQFTISNYELFDEIIAVNSTEEMKFLDSNINTNVTSLSDTRFDRILAKVQSATGNISIDREYFENAITLVVGSSWQEDEVLIVDAINLINQNDFKIRMIIAPHEPTMKNIDRLSSKLRNYTLLSRMESNDSNVMKNSHIIVDSIGKLLSLYSFADIVYVGGGFGAGVHSVTEPAGFGVPIACGAKFQNSPDAIYMQKNCSLEIINHSNDLINWLNLMFDTEMRKSLGDKNKKYLTERAGTSKIISDKLLSIMNLKQ